MGEPGQKWRCSQYRQWWLQFGGCSMGCVYVSHIICVVPSQSTEREWTVMPITSAPWRRGTGYNTRLPRYAPPQLGLVKTAIELRDHCDDGLYVQMSLCACHHRSSALKLQIEISSARTCTGVISHLICVVPHSFPSGNRSYRLNCLGFFSSTGTLGHRETEGGTLVQCCTVASPWTDPTFAVMFAYFPCTYIDNVWLDNVEIQRQAC